MHFFLAPATRWLRGYIDTQQGYLDSIANKPLFSRWGRLPGKLQNIEKPERWGRDIVWPGLQRLCCSLDALKDSLRYVCKTMLLLCPGKLVCRLNSKHCGLMSSACRTGRRGEGGVILLKPRHGCDQSYTGSLTHVDEFEIVGCWSRLQSSVMLSLHMECISSRPWGWKSVRGNRWLSISRVIVSVVLVFDGREV